MGDLLNKMDLNTSNPEEYETNGYTTQYLGQNIYLSQNLQSIGTYEHDAPRLHLTGFQFQVLNLHQKCFHGDDSVSQCLGTTIEQYLRRQVTMGNRGTVKQISIICS